MKTIGFPALVTTICSVHLDDDSGKLRAKVSRALAAAIDELCPHMKTPIRSSVFSVSDSLTVQLPSEVTQVTKVGFVCGDRVELLWQNNNVRRRLPSSDCTCSGTESSSCEACTFFNIEHDGLPSQMYGLKPAHVAKAEYRYNETEGRLEFGSGVSAGDTVLVEYKVVGSAADHAVIPAQWANMLGFYVGATVLSSTKPGTSSHLYRMFQNSYEAIKFSSNTYSAAEMISALMGESMYAPKN